MERRLPARVSAAQTNRQRRSALLLLPGALFMAIRAQLFAALMFINFCFSTLF
jgi:hypothetical protein